jgi:hypothetical protein
LLQRSYPAEEEIGEQGNIFPVHRAVSIEISSCGGCDLSLRHIGMGYAWFTTYAMGTLLTGVILRKKGWI